jgi:cytochrome c-type biogenesis protein CcmH/NrfG
METLGELGVIGFALIAGFIVLVLGVGGARSLQESSERRWPYAAATASAAAFAVAASIDWVWELSVIPIAFMVLAGGILASRRYSPPKAREAPIARAALIGCGIVALVAIAIPLRGAISVRDSQAAARSGDLPAALDDARNAHDLQPYAATPKIQEALILELMGEPAAGAAAAREATRADSRNWRTWLILSRLEAESGRAQPSVDAYRRAKGLNPRSILFANVNG